MERYFEINERGHNIRCKLYYNNLSDIRRMILFGHGFAGHKDNTAAQKFAQKVLTKYKGTAVMVFNWPCHGDDVKKKLILSDCLEYLDLAVQAAEKQFGAQELYAYATSFGAYLILKYIQERGNPFRKISLRCPAVNMYETLTQSVIGADEADKLRRGKNAQVGFDRKIEVNPAFLKDLQEGDIQQLDYLDFAEDILILHGTKDEVVPFDAVYRFADNNLIEFVPIENADHRFQNPQCMEQATKRTLEFFGF